MIFMVGDQAGAIAKKKEKGAHLKPKITQKPSRVVLCARNYMPFILMVHFRHVAVKLTSLQAFDVRYNINHGTFNLTHINM